MINSLKGIRQAEAGLTLLKDTPQVDVSLGFRPKEERIWVEQENPILQDLNGELKKNFEFRKMREITGN
jgi:hypothetical protein